MSSLLKTKNATGKDGKVIQHALYDLGHAFAIYRWEQTTGSDHLAEEIPYEGHADRRAAQEMAMGALTSLHQQALHEIHGDSYTDRHGITLYWAASVGRYVTIPDRA